MSEVDRFFDRELQQISLESREATHQAARELAADITRQIKEKFSNPSLAFQRGVKVHEFKGGSYVRLSPILSAHAETKKIRGNSNLWILLPEGQKRGFKRISPGYWNSLQTRYGRYLSIVPVSDGHVVLYRSSSGVVPIYKIQPTVTTKQRIDFYGKAEEIANKYGASFVR
ncbi:MAG: hypothetical protein AB4372_20350 [Xenococcus sp. (in: cyanobacteria)]